MKRVLNLLPWAAMVVMGVVCLPQTGITQERHSRIHGALESLREARNELEHSAHDFCGHKRDAMRATDEAMRQLRAAEECDRR